jgi:hypothetical protein
MVQVHVQDIPDLVGDLVGNLLHHPLSKDMIRKIADLVKIVHIIYLIVYLV